jgi:predicted amidohydrolase YtcJ
LEETAPYREQGAELVDLQGGCLLPGFIDAHGHCAKVIKEFTWVRLIEQDYFGAPEVSIGELVEKLAKRAEETAGSDEPVVGFGYHESCIKEHRHPDKFDLDKVSRERAVMISNTSFHIFVFNSRALELLGVDENTEDTETTKFWRVPGTKEPSGVIQGPVAQEHFFNLRVSGEEKRLEAFNAAQDYYFKNGITTACEGKSTADDIDIIRLAGEKGVMDIDVVSFVDYKSIDEVLERFSFKVGEEKNHLLVAGIKVISDGTLSSGAYLSKPFEGTLDNYGLQYVSAEALTEALARSLKNGWQVCVHAMGDAAVEKLLSAYEAAKAAVEKESGAGALKQPRAQNIINHASAIRKDQLPRVAADGFALSLYPSAACKLFEIFTSTIGNERASNSNPVRSAIENGILVTAHNDAPVMEANPLIIVWAAANRRSVQTGTVFGKEERVSVLDALKLTTANAAKQYGIDKSVGSIVAGKRADFVILSENPLQVNADDIRKLRVRQTIKGGKTVFREKAPAI